MPTSKKPRQKYLVLGGNTTEIWENRQVSVNLFILPRLNSTKWHSLRSPGTCAQSGWTCHIYFRIQVHQLHYAGCEPLFWSANSAFTNAKGEKDSGSGVRSQISETINRCILLSFQLAFKEGNQICIHLRGINLGIEWEAKLVFRSLPAWFLSDFGLQDIFLFTLPLPFRLGSLDQTWMEKCMQKLSGTFVSEEGRNGAEREARLDGSLQPLSSCGEPELAPFSEFSQREDKGAGL